MKQLFATIIFLGITLSSNAQNFKFGKVSKDELSQKQHLLDSSANAAVLYKKENIYFRYGSDGSFTQHREIHERIKIYNKEGFEYATEKIYLYQARAGGKEKLTSLKAYTYNLKDGKVIKDKLKKDGIFKEEANEFIDIKTLTMPNIKEGCVIEFTYEVVSPFLTIDDVLFQYNIPIDNLEVKIATPEYFVYNKKVNPTAFYLPNIKSSRLNRNTNKTNNTYSNLPSTTPTVYEFEEKLLSANETNIPALKEEAFAGSMNNYRAKLSMELSAILNKYGAVERSFSASWESVSKSIYDNSDFGNQLNRSSFFKDDVEGLVASVDDDFQKAFLLQTFVKSKVKWNGLYGFRAQKGTRKAYLDGEGNVADINLLLIAMLRSQGVNANPVLVSTKNHGVPLFPTRKGFNYVICMVQSEGGYALLDAAETYSMVNVLPERALNWQGRLIKDDGTSGWVSLRPTEKAKESTMFNVKIKEDFTVEGKVRKNLTDHVALRYRKKFTGISESEHIKQLEKNNGDIEISELNFENDVFITEPVKVTYNYQLNDGVDEIGGNLYFSPLFFLATKESPFKLDERQYPIDFIFPFEDKYIVNVMLPENYQVESLPKSEAFEFNDNDAKFTYIIKENGKFLQLTITFEMNSSFINPTDYKLFKDFFEKIVEKQGEQIVLKKV